MKAALAAISTLLLATSAVAQEFQSTSIVAPTKGQTIPSGKEFNVTLNTANIQGPIEHVRVTISMKGCEINPCDSYVDNPLVAENTLTAPNYGNGPAKVFVTNRYNLGASASEAFIEFINTTVTIAGGPY